jgi:hypothetical protein
MKNLTKILVLALVLVSIGIAGCQKEIGKNINNNENQFSNSIYTLPKLKVVNGILSFKTKKEFLTVYNYFAKKADSSQVVNNFKSKYNYIPLYEKIEKEENQWLNCKNLNIDNDPDDKYIDDDAYRILLNENGEVIIQNIIYKFVQNNIVYRINNLDWKALEKINMSQKNYFKNSKIDNVVILNWDPDKSSVCRQNYYYKDWKNYSTDKLVKYKVSVINVPFSACVKAKTVSLIRKRNRWVRYKTRVIAQVYNFQYYIYDAYSSQYNCENNRYPLQATGKRVSYSNRDKAEARVGIGRPFSVHKNDVRVYFYCNGWSKTMTLTW